MMMSGEDWRSKVNGCGLEANDLIMERTFGTTDSKFFFLFYLQALPNLGIWLPQLRIAPGEAICTPAPVQAWSSRLLYASISVLQYFVLIVFSAAGEFSLGFRKLPS
jgi:hypothetical protein